MDKQRARDILMAHACCSFGDISNNLCIMCPWNRKKDCVGTIVNEEIMIAVIKVLKGENTMRRMKLEDIKIKESFANTTPSEEKMEECRCHWRTFGKQDRFIVVDHNNVLIDGYVQYLVLKENGHEYAEVKISHCRKKRWTRKSTKDCVIPRYKNNPTTYIFGVHPNSNNAKTYTWRVPESWVGFADKIQIGDTVLCATKFGYSPVIVNRIEVLDKPPIDIPIKKVCRKEIRRNGTVVEL